MNEYSKFLSRMSYDAEDLSLMEMFHEETKFFPSTMDVGLPRIVKYLTEHRAVLETATNYKNYRYCQKYSLPRPDTSDAKLADCMNGRRSLHGFKGEEIKVNMLSNILFASMRSTRREVLAGGHGYTLDKRTYASGGGLYPVEVYPIVLNVEGLEARVTHYNQRNHSLNLLKEVKKDHVMSVLNDIDERLSGANVVFIITSVMERTTIKYGSRGYRFALLEAGEVAQNLSLCAVTEGCGTLPWGGYYDDKVADLLGIDNVSEVVVHCLSMGEPSSN